MTKYYKITNKEETHYGFIYKEGLNVLVEPFNDNPKVTCGKGGLYFTTIDNIHKFYPYGIYLREVFLPTDDPEFRMVKDPDGTKSRANKIILGKRYSLYDPKTYDMFGLDMSNNKNCLQFACQDDNVEFLELSKNNLLRMIKKEFHKFDDIIDTASRHGQKSVLEWLISFIKEYNKWHFDSEIKLINSYSKVIDIASGNGHTCILDWWKASGIKLMYSVNAINDASKNGHTCVLDWWKASGLELKYDSSAIDFASIRELDPANMKVLQWWIDSGLELKYSRCALVKAIKDENYDTLDFLKKYNFKFDTNLALCTASVNNKVGILKWLFKFFPDAEYDEKAMDEASANGHIDVLEWWKASGFELKYSSISIKEASKKNDMKMIQWWQTSGLELKYPPQFISWIIKNCPNPVLESWVNFLQKDSKLDAKYLV